MTQDRRHEQILAERFMHNYDIDATFDRMGNDAGEPDAIFLHNGKPLGVEMTTAYVEDAPLGEKNAGRVHNPDAVLCDVIQQRIDGKLQKKYHGTPEVVLCIEVKDPMADHRMINKCVEQVFVPDDQTLFQEIYLLHKAPVHEGGHDVLYKIK